MTNLTLTGTEVLQVLPVTAAGNLAASTGTTTTQAIANLANADGGVGLSSGALASGNFSVTSGTTLVNVTGMSLNVVAGATYLVDGYLSVTNGSAGGIKIGANGGTATATTFVADTWVYSTTTVEAENNVTAITSNLVAATVAATAVTINGTLIVNAGGTFALQAAQNVSSGTSLTVVNNSYISLTRIA